jgi:hypothetical protein
MEQSTPAPYTCNWDPLNPRYHYRAEFSEDQIGEVKHGLYKCLESMVPNVSQPLEIHQQICVFSRATSTFGKNQANIARDVDHVSNSKVFLSSIG